MAKFNVEYKVINKSETGVETRYSKSVLDGVMLQHLSDLMRTDESGNTSLEFITIRKVQEKVAKPVQKPKEAKP